MADLYKGEYNGLPDRDVRTIRDLIHYQYDKIIARSAFSVPDGTTAKGNYYGFIKQTFHELHKKLFPYLRTSPYCNPRDELYNVRNNVPKVLLLLLPVMKRIVVCEDKKGSGLDC